MILMLSDVHETNGVRVVRCSDNPYSVLVNVAIGGIRAHVALSITSLAVLSAHWDLLLQRREHAGSWS